jgi:primosomal protein N' (replication factor Y)
VPEIALTPQTVTRFAGRFPGQVGLIHSKLSSGERYDTWRRARQGEFGLIVGPRSALFSPLENIGLIVLDESHDDSYYQSEAAPHYHAREVAVRYAEQIGALCLLGSATPDVVSTYRAKSGQWQYLNLPSRILAHRDKVQTQLKQLKNKVELPTSKYQPLEGQVEATDLPPVSVIDMRQELKKGNRSIFSQDLQLALQQTIEQKQQAILFLNRRGSATYVFCRDCGHDLKCPQCEIPLTFHQQRGILLCHYCGYKRRMPDQCPQCGSRRIRHYGTGTQKVETEVKALFPNVQTLRWDYETTRKKRSHELILKQFANQHAEILIGTQMLAKGLDLPLVTLVGVILADVGLSLPDFRASERAFQVLTQVAGRAGRSPLGGQVILQTFQPEQYVIQTASRHDYNAFYQKELSFRRQTNYPPFSKIVRLEYQHYNPDEVERAAVKMSKQISAWLIEDNRRSTRMIGPVPSFFSRVGGIYRWQIILIGPDPASALRGRKIDGWKIEVNPTNLL